jgi:hypothetical protein
MAMDMMFPGAPGLVEVFDTHGEKATKVASTTTRILCTECACRQMDMVVAPETRSEDGA